MAISAPSERSPRPPRVPARADYDRATIDAILDEALVAHLGFAVDGQPYVIPTLHARVGDERLPPRLGGLAGWSARSAPACPPA